ncbi:MAG: SGNH/GDSL hydrolase family protein [Pseudomonadota bacterium]|nr:SGNH/GDSL hydrolase family protein [Pseudomonadota bacterium]
MGHIVLLGDSIFDNGVYVPGAPDVIKQLRAVLPDGWSATLCAVDGAVTRSVPAQLARVPDGATHLVLSIGGNDALGESYLLSAPARTVGEAVLMLAQAQERFARSYEDMLQSVLGMGLPTAVCTIYDTPSSASNQRVIRSALALFNDMITRAAFSRGLPLIDLRLICSEDEDYANPIEPSAKGGAKMAAAIASLVTGGDETQPRSVVVSR